MEFDPELGSNLLENKAIIINDCTNGGSCQCNPSSVLVNFTKWTQKYYSLRLKIGDKTNSQSTMLVEVWK
jgi:hypothetical protein